MQLFKRYKTILLLFFLVIMAISISLLGLQWHSAYHHEMAVIEDRFAEHAVNLDRIIKTTTDHLNMLRVEAEDDLTFSHVSSDSRSFSPLHEYMKPDALDPKQRYALSPISDIQKESIGSLQGIGRWQEVQQNLDYEREINMALRLNPGFKSTLQNLPEVTWAYYTSARQFMNIYPYDPDFRFETNMLDTSFFTGGMPQKNPQKQPFWTEAYLDLAGQGLMVTEAVPVYDNGEFRGTVAIDLTLKILNQIVKTFSYPQATLLVVGENQQLLAHPQLVRDTDQEIQSLAMALPDALKARITDLWDGPNGQLQSVGPWFIIHQSIQGTPWHLMCVLPKLAIYQSIATNGFFISLIPLLGLGLCLVATSQLLQTIFIQPACQLVDHINQSSQGIAPSLPQPLPSAWEPSFLTVSHTFNDNQLLVQEQTIQLQYLQSAQLQLVQSEKMSALGNLVAGVAHEINNPLGFVKGNLKELELNLDDVLEHLKLYQSQTSKAAIADHADEIDLDYLLEDIPKTLASMDTGCNRIKNISTSLRTFSRADQTTKTTFDIHEGLDSTILILKHRLKANEQRPAIQVEKQYGSIPAIPCFPGQLNQVFMNILANAIDVFDEMAQQATFADLTHTSQIISVATTFRADDQSVEIWIRDNGIGMPQAVMAKVFEHLFTTKEVGKGTGLGLAIAHQIVVESHSGSLDVQSRVGQGTEFCIRLPT